METFRKSFGERLRRYRERRFRSAAAFAEAVGFSSTTAYELERGEAWVGSDTLEKICTVLRIQADVLFADQPSIPEPTPEEALEVLRTVVEKARKTEGTL